MKHDKIRDLKTCPVCGKVFILESMDWTYKTTKYFAKKKNDTKYFCSWHCMRKDETTVPTDSKKKKGGAPKQLDSKQVIDDYINGKEPTIKIVMLEEFSKELNNILDLYRPNFLGKKEE